VLPQKYRLIYLTAIHTGPECTTILVNLPQIGLQAKHENVIHLVKGTEEEEEL
jgi:hypothetical protein